MYIWNHSIRGNSESVRRSAFTLIEIIVVVVILSIAAIVAIPMFSGATEMQLSAASDKLAADMEYAKSLAVTTQRNHKVVFDVNAESYQIQEADGTAVPDPVKRTTTFSVAYADEGRLSSVGISSVTFSGNTVHFNYTGAPSEGGSVVLDAGGSTMTVHVESGTGYISIQ